jgi:hypothetical protein
MEEWTATMSQGDPPTEQCARCHGRGWVCEAHPMYAWDGHCKMQTCYGAVGIPCSCNPNATRPPADDEPRR